MIRSASIPLLFLALVSSVVAETNGANSRSIENFALLDHQGKFHEFDYYCGLPDLKGIVLFIHGNGCPLVQKRVPELKRLRDEYQKRGILFGLLNANPQDEREEIAKEAEEFGIDIPILIDESQLVAEMLGVKRTAEAFLVSAEGRRILYRGAIDDRMSYQKEKPKAENHHLRDAIEAVLAGREVPKKITDAPGCKVAMPSDARPPDYERDVAPVLKRRCVICHTKDGLAPFALSNYKKVRGWSEMIAEVILTRQMPPWHADPHIGEFTNDCGLDPEEARTLLTWIKAGCPRGDGDDPLDGYVVANPDWHLGKPDEVILLPEQKVGAEGVFAYRYAVLDNPFDHDVWLTATEIRPGNTRVLHHVVVTAHSPEQPKHEQWITGYAPGTKGHAYPEGTAVHLRKGWKLKFQLHYTASGKPETDVTRLGLHFTREPVAKEFKTAIILTHKFEIPPGANEHPCEKSITVRKDSTFYALNPHMHYRGKRMSFEARYPDGRIEPLLSVPNYNFNWQRTYVFAKPKRIPAGTKIVVRNAWDNSKLNPHNPDPTRTVHWGDQSFEEMFFATIGYVED